MEDSFLLDDSMYGIDLSIMSNDRMENSFYDAMDMPYDPMLDFQPCDEISRALISVDTASLARNIGHIIGTVNQSPQAVPNTTETVGKHLLGALYKSNPTIFTLGVRNITQLSKSY